MQHTFESLTPTRTKVSLIFSADEVNTALDKALQATRKDLVLPGFRKGKAPLSVVEKRFGDDVRHRTTQDSINEAIKNVIQETDVQPLSEITLEEYVEFSRGRDATIVVAFDILPTIDFPPYESLVIEQENVSMSEEEIDISLERVRAITATLEDVEEDRLPQDGDTADVNFEGFEQDGTPIADIKGEHFVIELGMKQAIDDFEALVKTVKVGENGESTVTFPEDYAHTPMAGKVVTMRITLNSLKHKILPDLDEGFIQRTGHDSIESLRKAIEENHNAGKRQKARSKAMEKLLDELKIEIPIPKNLLETRIQRIITDRAVRAERGQAVAVPGTPEEQREAVMSEALDSLRAQVFFMVLGHKEKIEVTDQEVSMQVYQMAMRAGQDVEKVMEWYQRSGHMIEMRDRLLVDKAMDYIYSKAEVNYIDPQPETIDAKKVIKPKKTTKKKVATPTEDPAV